MLVFFRNIHFATAIGIGIVVALLRLMAFSGQLAPLEVAQGGLLYDDWFGVWASDPFYSALMAAVLVFIQAVLVNNLADQFRLLGDRSWLPGYAYAVVATLLPEFLFLSPALVAATFIAWSLRFLFFTYKAPKDAMLVFDAALWLSAASLFFPQTLLVFPAFFIGVSVMRSWRLRDQISFLAGLFVPVFLGWIWYFWNDLGAVFRERHLAGLFSWPEVELGMETASWVKLFLLGFLLLVYLMNAVQFGGGKSMLVQKSIAVLYWILFFISVLQILQFGDYWEILILAATPAAIFLAIAYQRMRPLYAEILNGIILVFMFVVQWMISS
ncbi:MAG: hypothetical protein JNJ57_18350 [Saprospiraceae bacterium]|nr:hypothetical protein [Saprospiraceae bacterium]